eukprot:gene33281-43034_t
MAVPSKQPDSNPSSHPSQRPTNQQMCVPTCEPTLRPSSYPSETPTRLPTEQPRTVPSIQPVHRPTAVPRSFPTSQPIKCPTEQPRVQPSYRPTAHPSRGPLSQPTQQPTIQPFYQPTQQPSQQPSFKPYRYPSGQPYCKPSRQPSSQPMQKPSSEPTYQSSSQPSQGPSEQPSSQPLLFPSMQPDSNPSRQPSSQPKNQPTWQPSTRPIRHPTTMPSAMPQPIPSKQPLTKPSSRPRSRPTEQPSRNPSRHPISLPTSQPSRQPSSRPSRTPSADPTVSPSTNPTIDGDKCSHMTYYVPANNTCLPCPANSKYFRTNRLTCGCNPGYSQLGFAGAMHCVLCAAGKYASNYSTSCLPCPPGYFTATTDSGTPQPCAVGYSAAVSGSTSCSPCPIGSYSALVGQATCSVCSDGRITPALASISEDFCLSPVPNFSMGFTALILVLLIAFKFIMYGRFSKTAFLRRERFVTPLAGICLETSNVIKDKMRFRPPPSQPPKPSSSILRASSHYLFSLVKMLLFFVLSITGMVLYVVVHYIGLLYSVIFTSLILWRSVSSAFQLPPLLDIISSALNSLAQSLGFPGWLLSYLFLPATFLIGILSTFQLDLEGNLNSQEQFHSLRAFLDRWIGSVYEEVRSLSVAVETVFTANNPMESIDRISKALLAILVMYPLQLLFSLLVVYPFKSVPSLVGVLPFMVIMIVFAMNPLQSLLKYSFTLANIATFVADNGMHPLSPACDNVSGYPMFDSILGISSTIIAWLLVVPIIYLLADVLVPGKLPQHAPIYAAFAPIFDAMTWTSNLTYKLLMSFRLPD